MTQRDGVSEKQVVHLGNLTLSGTTPAASDWVDVRGFDTVTFIPVVNTVTDAGTAAGFSADMEENTDTTDAGASSVAADDIVGSLTDLTVTDDADDDSVTGLVGYVGNNRYVRLNYTGTTGTNADVSVLAVLTKGHTQPATNVGTSVPAT